MRSDDDVLPLKPPKNSVMVWAAIAGIVIAIVYATNEPDSSSTDYPTCNGDECVEILRDMDYQELVDVQNLLCSYESAEC